MILVRFLDLKFLHQRAAIMIGTSNPPHYGGGMIRVTSSIAIDDDELDESFVRASGPGGQNVNKLSSAVQLRFDVRRSPNLPNDVRARPHPPPRARPPGGTPARAAASPATAC